MAAEPHTPEGKMAELSRSFPSRAKASGIHVWHANTLDRWASETPLSLGELVTARFLLAVWDPYHPWACGRFDVMEAIRVWDEPHRAAFLAWARDPWRAATTPVGASHGG